MKLNIPGGMTFLTLLGFEASIGAMLLVLAYYWLALTILEAGQILAVTGLVTMVLGRSSLSGLLSTEKRKLD